MIVHYQAGDEKSHADLGRKLKTLKPGEYVIEIKRNHAIRSISQNKYYFGVCLKIISTETGMTPEELHDLFKFKFNAKMIQFKNGWTEVVPGSTKKLDSAKFGVYINKVRQYVLNQFNIVIPDPKDVDRAQWADIQEAFDKVYNQF